LLCDDFARLGFRRILVDPAVRQVCICDPCHPYTLPTSPVIVQPHEADEAWWCTPHIIGHPPTATMRSKLVDVLESRLAAADMSEPCATSHLVLRRHTSPGCLSACHMT
jgi:hypothetical protein